jgi:hypothetical protein
LDICHLPNISSNPPFLFVPSPLLTCTFECTNSAVRKRAMPQKMCCWAKISYCNYSDLKWPSLEFRETYEWYIRKLFITISNMFLGFKSGVMKKLICDFLVHHEHFYAVVWSNINKYTSTAPFKLE